MAEPEEIESLRRLINETEDVAPYDDVSLALRIDASTNGLRSLAGDIWTEKASRYAELVDVQEGSSRRALGDLYEQALKMAAAYGANLDEGSVVKKRRVGTRQIVRP